MQDLSTGEKSVGVSDSQQIEALLYHPFKCAALAVGVKGKVI
jgi:hypothetical protein